MQNEQKFHVNITSNFGFHTRKPFVGLAITGADVLINLSPEEARGIAMNLLECAESAETDAFMIQYLERLGMREEEKRVTVLIDFRKFREKLNNGNKR